MTRDTLAAIRRYVRAWRARRQLARFRRLSARAAFAASRYTELSGRLELIAITGGPRAELVAWAPPAEPTLLRRMCRAAADRAVSVSITTMTGRKRGRHYAGAPRMTARTPSSPRSTARTVGAHRAVKSTPVAQLDEMTTTMAGRIAYVHEEIGGSGTLAYLRALRGTRDEHAIRRHRRPGLLTRALPSWDLVTA